ncbi:13333_t:CDS:2 [Entrophospora sp. SA101]|nr:13333_t:CDS:2 [Entrophospora sp. SA101]
MGQGAGPQPNLAGTSIQGIGRTATPPPRQPPNWQTTVTQSPGGQQGVVDPFITVIRSSSPPILPITQPIAIPVPTTQPQPPPPQPIAPQPMPPLVPFPQQPPVTTQQQQLPLPVPPVTVASTQPTQPPPGQPPVGGTFGAVDLKLGREKCEFAKPELHLLGHIIGKDGKKPDPAKVEEVYAWIFKRSIANV